MLKFLYNTFPGRIILKTLCKPTISKICGNIMDSKISLLLVKPFVRKNNIDLSDFYSDDFHCFNDFFCRKIKPELRPFSAEENAFLAPCDGLLSIYEINDMTVLPVKQSHYSISELLNDNKLAEEFADGYCLVYRLCVNHYHRYSYFDDGSKGENIRIKGELHTVRPIALKSYPVFVRNTREYTVMNTQNFGKVVQVEVGALLVGKIINEHGTYDFSRGEEKGHFEYGGSTIVLLLKKNSVNFSKKFDDIINTGVEIAVQMGEHIGNAEKDNRFT